MLNRRLWLALSCLMASSSVVTTAYAANITATTAKAQTSYQLLTKFYAQKDRRSPQAQQILETLLAQDPNNLAANKEMAYLLLHYKKPGPALKYLIKSAQLEPNNEQLKLQIAYTYVASGNTNKAKRVFYTLARKSNNAKVRYQARKEYRLLRTSHLQKAEYQLMTRYYAIKFKKRQAAQLILKRVLKINPRNKQALLEMGHLLLQQKKYKASLPYFLRAQAISCNDQKIKLQLAYIYMKLGWKTAAISKFGELSYYKSSPQQRRAIRELKALSPEYFFVDNGKMLPDPWFADLYFAPYYSTRFHNAVYPVRVRVGRRFGKKFSVYGVVRNTMDTNSLRDLYRDIYEDNAVILGIGASYQPVLRWPLFFYAEYGVGYDIKYQNRNRWRPDFRSGLYFYKEWGHKKTFASKLAWPFKPLGSLYGSFAYYSRYNHNFIGNIRLRQGFRVLEWRHSTLDLYGVLNYWFDTKHEYQNNIANIGLGLAFTPNNTIPLVLRLEQIKGFYIGNYADNPYKNNYWKTVISVETYFQF